MLYAVSNMVCKDIQSLFHDLETIEHGTLRVEGICTTIVNYGKFAESVEALVKEIRKKMYEFHDEMVMMGMKNGFGEERFENDKVCKLFLEIEDDIREFQKIVAEEENSLVNLITREIEVTVADVMALAGLRKCIEISKEMVASLFYTMQVTNKYVDLFKESEVNGK